MTLDGLRLHHEDDGRTRRLHEPAVVSAQSPRCEAAAEAAQRGLLTSCVPTAGSHGSSQCCSVPAMPMMFTVSLACFVGIGCSATPPGLLLEPEEPWGDPGRRPRARPAGRREADGEDADSPLPPGGSRIQSLRLRAVSVMCYGWVK